MRASQSLLTCSDNYMIEALDDGDGLRVIISFVTVNSHHVSHRSLSTCTCLACDMALYAIDITCVSTATACFFPSNRPSVACGLHCSSTDTHLRYCSRRLTTYSTYS